MKQELALPKYSKMKLVSIVYGNDDPATSLTVLQGLLSAYPNLRGIISPTTVGISTAAQYLDTHKSLLKHLTLTGLGLPSQMKKYVLDGTCKEFELWNPSPTWATSPAMQLRRWRRADHRQARADLHRRQAGQLQNPTRLPAPPALRSCSARRRCSTRPTSTRLRRTSERLRNAQAASASRRGQVLCRVQCLGHGPGHSSDKRSTGANEVNEQWPDAFVSGFTSVLRKGRNMSVATPRSGLKCSTRYEALAGRTTRCSW